MVKSNKRIGLRGAAALHLRGARDLSKKAPLVFPMIALHAAVSALSPYVSVYLSARLIDELAGARRADILWRQSVLIVVLSALCQIASAVLLRVKNVQTDAASSHYQWMLSDKFLRMDYADADDQKTHDLYSQIVGSESYSGLGMWRVIQLAEKLCAAAFGVLGAVTLTASLFTLPVPDTAGRLTLLNHPAFMLGLALLLGAITLVSSLCRNRAMRCWSEAGEEARFGNRVSQAFSTFDKDCEMAKDVRMYNQQDIALYYIKRCNVFGDGGIFDRMLRGTVGVMEAIAGSVSAVLTGLVYVFVCVKAWAGAFGVGAVTQYVGAVTALSKNISGIVEALGTMRSNAPYMQTIYEFMDIPNAMYQGSLTTEKRADRQYDVEFRDVSFKYPGSEVWTLRHVNLRFAVGKRLAVVGENGSGKSTFIKLLCRLYDPQEGQILLNGIDIRKYNYRDYMDIFSIVFQDFQLLAQPLGANVAGSTAYDEARVKKALLDAGFGDRLEALTKGLDTMLYREFSEDGVEVSGGEAQKIAIARALYKDAPFIILDEPTAALDPVAEAEIYSQFSRISGDRTAIYISHRLSSCKFCDEIVVFDAGRVIQQGTHEALLELKDGKYHALWHAQAQYYT